MKCFLRPSGAPLTEALPHNSVSQAATAFKKQARENPRYRASIHVGRSIEELKSKPDYNLNLGARGALQLRKVP